MKICFYVSENKFGMQWLKISIRISSWKLHPQNFQVLPRDQRIPPSKCSTRFSWPLLHYGIFPLKTYSVVTSVAIVRSFLNFAQSTAVSLNLKMIWQSSNGLWANKICKDLENYNRPGPNEFTLQNVHLFSDGPGTRGLQCSVTFLLPLREMPEHTECPVDLVAIGHVTLVAITDTTILVSCRCKSSHCSSFEDQGPDSV